MSKNDSRLLQFCRYYNGESECPFRDNDKKMFWFYEKDWLQTLESGQTGFFEQMVNEYLAVGLKDFRFDDDTPVTLIALLFNRYCKSTGLPMIENVKPFQTFYTDKYYA